MQREVVYTYRNETIDSEEPRTLIYEVIDEAVPAKVKEYLDGDDEPNYAGLMHWVNTTFPLGLTKEKAQFETRTRRRKRAVPDRENQGRLRAQIESRRADRGEEPGALHHSERDRSALAGASLCDGCAARRRLSPRLRAEGSADRIQDRSLRHVRRADGEH